MLHEQTSGLGVRKEGVWGMERQRFWLWDGEHDLGRRYDPDDPVLRASRRQSWKILVSSDGEIPLPLPGRRRNWPFNRSQAGTETGSWGAAGRAAVGRASKSLLPFKEASQAITASLPAAVTGV